MVATVTPDL